MKTPNPDALLICAVSVWLITVQPAHSFYNATSGRWLSRDPMCEASFRVSSGQQSNRGTASRLCDYTFATNDPVGHWDVLGLRPGNPLCGAYGCIDPPYLPPPSVPTCCCNGKTVPKPPTDTGIKTWKWVDSVPNPSNPSGAHDMHVWLTWDSQNAGPGSVDANAVIGTGYVSSPAAGIILFGNSPRTTPTPVMLSKCKYDLIEYRII